MTETIDIATRAATEPHLVVTADAYWVLHREREGGQSLNTVTTYLLRIDQAGGITQLDLGNIERLSIAASDDTVAVIGDVVDSDPVQTRFFTADASGLGTAVDLVGASARNTRAFLRVDSGWGRFYAEPGEMTASYERLDDAGARIGAEVAFTTLVSKLVWTGSMIARFGPEPTDAELEFYDSAGASLGPPVAIPGLEVSDAWWAGDAFITVAQYKGTPSLPAVVQRVELDGTLGWSRSIPNVVTVGVSPQGLGIAELDETDIKVTAHALADGAEGGWFEIGGSELDGLVRLGDEYGVLYGAAPSFATGCVVSME